MDSFDDLLSSSSRALEANPFEDPFAKLRSESPDPWASFASQGVVEPPPQAPLTSEEVRAVIDDPEPEPDDASTLDEPQAPHEEDLDIPTPVTSGFRESIPTEDISDLPRPIAHETLPEPTSWDGHLTDTIPYSPVSSPLDSALHNSLDGTFSGLSMGGETSGGWQTPDLAAPVEQAWADTDEQTLEPSAPPPLAVNDSSSMFQIQVEDPQKVGDPIRPFIMYTVRTQTTSPLFEKSTFSVLRRYSDFLWLYETLSYNNPGVFVPPIPEKSPFGRFESQFVEQRRLALEKCIQKITNHATLCKDPDLKLFLGSDNFSLDIKHRKLDPIGERGSFITSIGSTITGSKFHETDEWFDSKKTYIDGIESQLKGLAKVIEAESKQRIELSVSLGELSNSLKELSSSEMDPRLVKPLGALSVLQTKSQELQHAQAVEDTTSLMNTADEYARTINSVRLAFNSRMRCYSIWQAAESETRRIRQQHEKTRNRGASIVQVAEAEKKSLDAKDDFENAGKMIKSEMLKFEEERVQDLKLSLENLVNGMISRQRETINYWEKYQESLLDKPASEG